ncbi:uncharacterized protein UBRO_05265 [Ustilago bromivora]|uniref:WW domain-containing protein n=1 Tax=Ustilago bromivora TaxID=307758 RepID=A0A1K0GSL2_9BASI|nr:uncharacterized protein UBRO_05265 [Ustilago bromivora]
MGDNAAGPSSTQPPPRWTAHVSPVGRTYYHNSGSGVSTYHPPHLPKPKREKPVSKTPIPNTSGWFKITTNKDNVFFFQPETKASEWLPPSEIAAAVREMEENEVKHKRRLKREAEQKQREERDRVRREKRQLKRKAEEGVAITEFDASAKRPRADGDDDEEEEEEEEDEDNDDDNDDMDEDSIASIDEAQAESLPQDAAEANGNDEQDDEGWQRQIAEKMAAEAEAEAEAAAANDADTNSQHNPPARTPTPDAPQPEVTTTLEEQKTTFMAHLTSLNGTKSEVNPMAPWDLEQSKFASNPSLHALPQREREDVFNEWCKLRIREKRAAKAAAASASSQPASSSKSTGADPLSKPAEEAFRALLKNQVRSTRTKYADFKAAFARDARFSSYGKGEGDREKLFKTHLIELGEQKRAAAEKADKDFLDLLSDKIPGNYRNKVATAKSQAANNGKEAEKEAISTVWVEAKRSPGVLEDKRYDAVGSSTRRFELFCSWAKGERKPHPSSASIAHATSSRPTTERQERREQQDLPAARKAAEKEEARRRALAEREAKVRRERDRINRLNRSAFSAATRSESVLSFQQLLLDAVHSAHISYSEALPQLSSDGRFHAPALSEDEKEQLFREHQQRLATKEQSKIGSVFARYAKKLDTQAEDVIALTLQDEELSHLPMQMYREDKAKLKAAYAKWDAERKKSAEKEFKEMLTESAFVEFWGRLKKEVNASSDVGEKKREARQGEEDDGEEGDGTTMLDLARKVDLGEIESVLRKDARFRACRHAPEQRRRWIREHLEGLAAPGKSVHR